MVCFRLFKSKTSKVEKNNFKEVNALNTELYRRNGTVKNKMETAREILSNKQMRLQSSLEELARGQRSDISR